LTDSPKETPKDKDAPASTTSDAAGAKAEKPSGVAGAKAKTPPSAQGRAGKTGARRKAGPKAANKKAGKGPGPRAARQAAKRLIETPAKPDPAQDTPAQKATTPAPGAAAQANPAQAKPAPANPAQAKPAPQAQTPRAVAQAAAAAQGDLGPVSPAAPPAATRPRHWGVVLSFVLFVVLPAMITAWYLWERAADQYASRLAFSVRTEEAGSALEFLGGISSLSGSGSADTDVLYQFIQSQELVREVDDDLDLVAIWSRPGIERDPIFAYDPDGTIEDLQRQWDRMISITYDSGTQLIQLRVQAFDPDDAQAIAEAIYARSTEMINQLSAIAREDAIRYARSDLEQAVERLKQARAALTQFRNRTQIVDPTVDLQGQAGLVNTLNQQLAEALIELDLLRETTRQGDPRISQAERRIRVIEARIGEERQKLGLGGNGAADQEAFADLVGEYERLVVEQSFAENSYTSALAAFDASRAEAGRQSRYLAAHVRPTLAERAEYPERPILLTLITLFLFLVWAVVVLTVYSLRDRR